MLKAIDEQDTEHLVRVPYIWHRSSLNYMVMPYSATVDDVINKLADRQFKSNLSLEAKLLSFNSIKWELKNVSTLNRLIHLDLSDMRILVILDNSAIKERSFWQRLCSSCSSVESIEFDTVTVDDLVLKLKNPTKFY